MVVGLTGGIGSGKSLIADILELLGVKVYKSDHRARHLMTHDPVVVEQLTELFGDGVFLEGVPDRAKIASRVFDDRDLLDRLNAIVHPAVARDFEKWKPAAIEQGPYAVKETAILFEAGLEGGVDRSVLVVAPEELRISRVIRRDKTSREHVLKRLSNQWPDRKKLPLADYIIVNDNAHPLIRQIMEIHNLLCAKSQSD